MDRIFSPFLLLLTVFFLSLPTLASSHWTDSAQDVCAEGDSSDSQGDPGLTLPPPYLSGPVWQDLRLLLSFAAGVSFMHAMEAARGDRDAQQASAGVLERKFQMYPYAL
mmetsp:Transcript_689/g.1406  ORF Transcript_689/g.1406 Transcript_689/m.1406 type:complete len:109 (+) Transcript_689:83-409(+)